MDTEPAVFQLVAPGGSAWPDLLGLWQVAVEVKFALQEGGDERAGSPGQESETALLWRCTLPSDPIEAARLLGRRELTLRRASAALDAAGPTLTADLELLRSARTDLAYNLPLSAEGPSVTGPARLMVLRWAFLAADSFQRFQDTEGLEKPSVSGSVAYGIADIPGLDAAIQAVSGFSALARRLVDVPSWVESRVGERRVALTRVDWAGSLRTYCAPGGDPGLASQHARLVAQVLATRREWLRLLLLVIAGAARLGAALAGGPFSLLALGAIWNYLQEVVQQFQALTEN